MLWRKGDRIRKSLLLHQQPAYQVPQALARHNPGEFPSANVRTAPTPSEPNTPIAEPGFIVANAPTTIIPQVPEESEEPDRHPDQASMLPDENAVGQQNRVEDSEDKRSQEEVMSSSSLESTEVSKTQETEKEAEKTEAPKPSEQKQPVEVSEPEKKVEIIEEKMTNLNTKEEVVDEDHRPQPPDDDSVPPVDDNVPDDSGEDEMPDSTTPAIVDNDEDDDL